MAHSILGAASQLRADLHAEARDFLHLMVSTLLEDGPESAQCAYAQLAGHVDALAAGEAVRISRYELPPDHPLAAPHGGRPTDSLVLDSDNVLVELTEPRFVR